MPNSKLMEYSDYKNECIINEKHVCPHTELSGKICSACKIPDSTCPHCGGVDRKHYLNCCTWKRLERY